MSTPFNDPDINAQIEVEIMRIQARVVRMAADYMIVDFDSFIVEALVDSLDVHARAYFGQVKHDHDVPEYRRYLQGVGAALLRNAEKRSHLSDPYSDERLRRVAESSNELIRKRTRLEPQQYETELQNCIEQIRCELMPEALKWHSWKSQILARILSRFEARYLTWSAEAMERLMGRRDAPRDPLIPPNGPKTPRDGNQGEGVAEPKDRSRVPSDDQVPETKWNEIEIQFLSDDRLQVISRGATQTRNFAEMGCQDGRTKTPNIAWIIFRELAKQNGIISKPSSPGENWKTVEKAIQRLRQILRDQFKIADDPLPFVPSVGYQARFTISCSAAFKT